MCAYNYCISSIINIRHDRKKYRLNRTEQNKQIFYFRTYTQYIVAIQYIYICHVWYMLHSDNSYTCLRDNNSVCIFVSENNKTHTHTHTHIRTYAHKHKQRQQHTLTHTHTHTHTYTYRYTCLAFSTLYSFVKK